MKKLTLNACVVAAVVFMYSCNGNNSESKTDSTTTKTENTLEKAGDKASEIGEKVGDKVSDVASDAKDKVSDVVGKQKDDKDFLMEAASGGMMEVELGKIAATNAQSAKVKEFGKMMVTDHSKANTELKSVATKKNITLTADLMDDHKKHVDMLRSKKGAEFDKAYMDMMVDDHKKDVDEFEDEANKGTDADIKAFAAKTLPVLKKHMQAAESINSSVGKQ